MKVELLITGDCAPCLKAETLWRTLCQERDVALSVLDVRESEGKKLLNNMRLNALPALLINGELVAVGVQSHAQAEELLTTAGRGMAMADR